MDRKGKVKMFGRQLWWVLLMCSYAKNSVSTPAGSQWQLVVMETKPHCEIHLHETTMQ